MVKNVLIFISWAVAGGLAYHAHFLSGENGVLRAELDARADYEVRYRQQLELNTSQREAFETQARQLQSNLAGAQAQMSNLSQALQETRELVVPPAGQVAEEVATGSTDGQL